MFYKYSEVLSAQTQRIGITILRRMLKQEVAGYFFTVQSCGGCLQLAKLTQSSERVL